MGVIQLRHEKRLYMRFESSHHGDENHANSHLQEGSKSSHFRLMTMMVVVQWPTYFTIYSENTLCT